MRCSGNKLEATNSGPEEGKDVVQKASSVNNYKLVGAGCDVWGSKRLALARALRDSVLPAAGPALPPWIIESGTLLGACTSPVSPYPAQLFALTARPHRAHGQVHPARR